MTGILLLTTGLASDSRYLTRATAPSDQHLSSLGLRKLWQTHIPTAGARDQLAKLQVIGDLMIAQTASGGVVALDAETGRMIWQMRFAGVMPGAWAAAGANENNIFVIADNRLLALNRKSGSIDWSIQVPHLPATTVMAEGSHVFYTAANGEMVAYRIPHTKAQVLQTDNNTLASESIITKPQRTWGMRLMTPMEQPPLVVNNRLVLPQLDGTVVILHRDRPRVAERLPKMGALTAPVARADDELYFGSHDCSVTAIEVTPEGLHQHWRFSGDGRIMQKPLAAGNDLLVTCEQGSLCCLDRKYGTLKWKNPQMKQILAVTRRSVIAINHLDQLCAFDRVHGSALGICNSTGFAMPIQNDQTDRVYLANHDGVVVAMRDSQAQSDKPLIHFPPRASAANPLDDLPAATAEAKSAKARASESNSSDSKSTEKKIQEMKDK